MRIIVALSCPWSSSASTAWLVPSVPDAPWFLITGTLFMLWAVGALLINLLREALTRELLPISSQHRRSIFKVARIVLLSS